MNPNPSQKLHQVLQDALFTEGECFPFGITSIKAFTFVEAFFMPKNQPSVEDLEGILKWYKK